MDLLLRSYATVTTRSQQYPRSEAHVRRALLLSALMAVGAAAACEDGADILIIDEPSSTLLVENNDDEGEGSLRAALEAASADPAVNSIQVGTGLGTVSIASSLEYTGDQPLRIVGNGLVIDGGGCGCDLLVASGGADLDLFDLTLKNGNRGLSVPVPGSVTGRMVVRLVRVTVEDNDGHGVYVGEGAGGSAASLQVEMVSSTVRRNGYADGSPDLDGIRVEESGEGELTFVARDLAATDNAGDGVDLREAGTGGLVVETQESSFDGNGEQPQDPTEPEDGFDASEAGSGSLDARIIASSASENLDQGIELTESGAGDLRATLSEVDALSNRGDNILFQEDFDALGGAVPGAGGIIATMTDVTAQEADDDGAQLDEFGAGDLTVQVQNGDFSDNEDDGLSVTQAGTGIGRLHLVNVVTEGNGGLPVDSEGTAVTEGNDQTTTVRVRNDDDSGFGSFRAALDAATADPSVTTIVFEAGVGLIEISRSLEFGGTQDLLISGGGAAVDGEDCACDAFVLTGGGDLIIEELSFLNASGNGVTKSGGGDLTLRELIIEDVQGTGVFMDVPSTATGLVTVILDQANIQDSGLHGLHVDDLSDGGGGGTGGNSAAGILLEMNSAVIRGNGFRQDVTDRDGVRIEEGGSGDIEVRITGSTVVENAGDGLELKESGLGEVDVDIRLGFLDSNGSQPQNPDRLEDGLDIQEAGPGDVRLVVWGEGTSAASVRNNSDLGFQITEEGSGSVLTDLDLVVATGNGSGMLEVTEDTDAEEAPTEGSGGITAEFNEVFAGASGEDGIRLTEYGVGDLRFTAHGLDSSDNGGDGLWMDEDGIGALAVDIRNSFFDDNGRVPLDPDDLGAGVQGMEAGSGSVDVHIVNTSMLRNPTDGLELTESGSGDLRSTLSAVTASSNRWDNVRLVEDLDALDQVAGGSGSLFLAATQLTANSAQRDGVQLVEIGFGNLTGQIAASQIRNNGDNGVDASQDGDGSGQLQLVDVTFGGNFGGDVALLGVTVPDPGAGG
jgi:hypothetical protein